MIFFETASISQVFSLNLARKAYELNMEKRRGDKLLFQVRILLFYLKHFASDAAAHSGPGASTQKGSYRRNL